MGVTGRMSDSERHVGDRVVVTWHTKEYAATVISAKHQRFPIVETDEPYDADGSRVMPRHSFELYDVFNDGTAP